MLEDPKDPSVRKLTGSAHADLMLHLVSARGKTCMDYAIREWNKEQTKSACPSHDSKWITITLGCAANVL